MGRLVLAAAVVALITPAALADMYQDASNASLPAARVNLNAQPSLDARDYGVKCDGGTDDRPALQAALDAAATNGNVVFLSGKTANTTCLLGGAVIAPAGTTLWSTPGTVTLKPTAGNTASPVLFAGSANVTVSGVTFDGGGQDFGTANNVTQLFSVSNVVFDTVKWQNTRGIALLASTAIKNSGVRNSTFTNIGNHWRTTFAPADRQQAIAFCCGAVADSYGNFVTNSTFTDVGLDPVSTGNQKDFLFAGNKCDMEQGQHTLVPTSAYGGCFYSTGNDTVTVANNRIDGAAGNGIDIIDTKEIVVTGNQVVSSGDCGIGVFGMGNAAITGNVVRNSGQWTGAALANGGSGLCLANGSTGGRIAVTGNVATDDQGVKTQRYGVNVKVGSTFADLRVGANATGGNLLGNLSGLGSVAALPACNADMKSSVMVVNDQNGAPTYRGALTGGGSLSVLAYCNGASWEAH